MYFKLLASIYLLMDFTVAKVQKSHFLKFSQSDTI